MYHGFPTVPAGRTGSHSRAHLFVVTAGSMIVLSMLGLGAAGGIVGGVGVTSTGPSGSGTALGSGSSQDTGPSPTVVPTASSSSPAAEQTTEATSTPTTVPATPPSVPQPGPANPSPFHPTSPSPSWPTASVPADPGAGQGGPVSGGHVDTALHWALGALDGDTMQVLVGATTEQVRLIGLDAPDLTDRECWSLMAANRLLGLVRNRSVHLVRDPAQPDRDRDGRLLRHVSTTDGELVSEVLVEGGFARVRSSDGQHEHQAALRAAEERAKAKRLGIWGASCAAHPAAADPAPTTSTDPGKSSQGGHGARD